MYRRVASDIDISQSIEPIPIDKIAKNIGIHQIRENRSVRIRGNK